MKQIKLILAGLLLLCVSCSKVEKIGEVKIVDSYVNDAGNKVFVMSDGNMTIPVSRQNLIYFFDKKYQKIGALCSDAWYYQWLVAEVGDKALVYKYHGNNDICYILQLPEDYTIKHQITRVTKYDGELNKIDGKINLDAHLLSGTSGTGTINSKGLKCPNMFINIYFADHDPITVNAADNQLWLDVEAGGTVIERRINGHITFAPEF